MTIEDIAPAGTATGLADRLKAGTWSLHREAERSGILQDLLRDRAGVQDYALLLVNLLPVYEALERGLDDLPPESPVRTLAQPDVYRAEALRRDIVALGASVPHEASLLPAGRAYADAVIRAAAGDGERLVAHAYVRYLGDMNGGQILKRLLGRHLGLRDDQLGFYLFPALDDPQAAAADYRDAIDRIPMAPAAADRVLAEAQAAFRLNIALSVAVQGAACEGGAERS